MDYRDLLKKYIGLIGDREGRTFIPHTANYPNFTPEELDELRRLDKESYLDQYGNKI